MNYRSYLTFKSVSDFWATLYITVSMPKVKKDQFVVHRKKLTQGTKSTFSIRNLVLDLFGLLHK